jgi:hypothetical protein
MLGAGAALGVAEQAMRAALASSGAALLQAVLDEQDDGCAGPHSGCGCGGQAVYSGSRPKTITTVLGAVTLQRAWYHCAACRAGFAPRDRQLGLLADGALSPGLAEMAALAGAEVSFARAAALLAGLAGVTVSARLFTVSRLDQDGRPVMDPGSPSYACTFDGKDALASLVKAEYLRRGGEHFRQVVALGDGAAWIRAMATGLYPHATHIVDIYHAREHLHDPAAHLAFITPDPAAWLEDRSAELDAGNIEAIITAARAYPLAGIKASELDRTLGYFERNIHRCATPASGSQACSPARAPSREASRPSSSSAPNNPACTGPPKAPPASSPCAASRQAAAGTTSSHPAQPQPPGFAQPSDRHRNSDPQATGPSKIIPNDPVVHPCSGAICWAGRAWRYYRIASVCVGGRRRPAQVLRVQGGRDASRRRCVRVGSAARRCPLIEGRSGYREPAAGGG